MMVKLPTKEDSKSKDPNSESNKDIMRRPKHALSNMKKLPKVCAQHIPFELKYKVHKHGIITPSILFKTK
jgi:hypothetical protein